jgi:hypothetical protein
VTFFENNGILGFYFPLPMLLLRILRSKLIQNYLVRGWRGGGQATLATLILFDLNGQNSLVKVWEPMQYITLI